MTQIPARSRRTRLLTGAALVAAGAASLLIGTAAQAQPVVDGDTEVEEVFVTGSRIRLEGFEASTPLTVVNAEEIKAAGTANVEQILADSPQFSGGASGRTNNGVPGGTATINLRGFGSTRNLVLVNGRRFAISGASQVTDINTIPAALIARTEVVTGGSSAVYGSDAITGVVNFIMRDDFEGLELRGQSNLDSATKSKNYNFDVTFGGNFMDDRGNAVVSVNYLKRAGITRGERGDIFGIQLDDGCIQPGSGSRRTPGTPRPVPSGQTCVGSGGELGFVQGGSGDIPLSRLSGIPLPGSAQSNPALNAAYAAAGIGAFDAFGVTFDESGGTVRRALDPQDRYNLQPPNYLIVPQERWMVNTFSHFDITEKVTAYSEFHFSNNRVDARLAPSNVGVATLFNVNNPYLSPAMQEVFRQLDLRETGTTTITAGTLTRTTTPGDGLAVVTAGKRYEEVGPRLADTRRNVFRANFGFRGEFGDLSSSFLKDLNWDVYYTYSRTETTEKLSNAISRSRLQASQLSVGGAAPVCNIFGAQVSDACANAIRISATNSTDAEMQVAAANLGGQLFDLPAGPIGFSLGAEWRKMSAVYQPDSFLSSGDVVGFNAGLPTGGSLSANEVYGEVRVPILVDQPLFQSLALNGAFRYSDYSLDGVGGVWTYLGGVDWKMNDQIAFRAQYQRAIRAPNVQELFGGLSRSVGSATDPCSNRGNAALRTEAARAVCVATGVPASQVFTAGVQPNTIIPADFGGSPDVGEEVSDTYTAGFVLSPSFVPRLYLSVDYFSISLDGAIGQLGGGLNNTLNLCYNVIQDASSEFCQAIRRDPQTGAITDNYAAQIRSANTGKLKTSGVDFAGRYNFDLNFGIPMFGEVSELSVSTDWTYTHEFTSTPVAAFPDITQECIGAWGPSCGDANAKWRGASRVTWISGDLSLSLRHRYLGPVKDARYLLPARGRATRPARADQPQPRLDAQHYFDLSFNYSVTEEAEVFGGARNLFNAKVPGTGTAGGVGAAYDMLGTEFFLGATLKFN
jgi:outer membrane receptor protein involved in Fe transport